MMDARTLAESLGGRWYGGNGGYGLCLCPAHGNTRTPALSLSNADDGRLLAKCHAGCTFEEIIDALRGLGLIEGRGSYSPPSPVEIAKREAEARGEAEKRARVALAIWNESQPITGTIAETYLRNRAITCDLPESLRYHPEAWHGPTARLMPAMIALVLGADRPAIHRTYLAPDGTGKAEVEPNKMMMGATAGGAARLTESGNKLVICEGIETGLALASGLLNAPAAIWAALSTSGMQSLRLPDFPGRLTVATDGDEPGKAAGMVLAPPSVKPGAAQPYHWIRSPDDYDMAECPEWLLDECRRDAKKAVLPASGAVGVQLRPGYKDKTADDYAELFIGMQTDGMKHESVRDTAASLAAMGIKPEAVEGFVRAHCPVWDENVENLIASAFQKFAIDQAEQEFSDDPVDFTGRFDPPPLPSGLLPTVIEDFARVMGEQTGADPAGFAVSALVVCAAAISDKVKIKPKRHGNWEEAPRIWGLLVGLPSTKKSPILLSAAAPLTAINNRSMREWKRAHDLWSAASKKDKGQTPEPKQTRFCMRDVTVESAQDILANSPDGVLMLKDEMSGFFGALGKYNAGASAADRAFWLETYNGGETTVDRIKRGSTLIPNTSVCLLGGIQPGPIKKLANASDDDGLLQRMFPVVLRPANEGIDAPAPAVEEQYKTLVERLHSIRLPEGSCGNLEFDEGGLKIRERLGRQHHELQNVDAVNIKFASHIGKYDGLFARLCVIWHCIENADATSLPLQVSSDLAERVASFLHNFLLRHAWTFYAGVLGLSDEHDKLAAIAGHILAHKLERVTHRDAVRFNQILRNTRERDTRPLFEQLETMGWLVCAGSTRANTSPQWLVNPAVHARFAERAEAELFRRTKARQILTSLATGR